MAQSISQEAIGATGLPGATAASRHAGATTSGAPTTGTFAVGDFIIDQTGRVYVCTVAGTPGTWTQVGPTTTSVTMAGDVTGNSATSTVAKINGTTLGTLSGATSGQALAWNGSAWAPTTISGGAPGTIVSSFISSNVTFTTSATNITSISLVAGTWLLHYQALCWESSNDAFDIWVGPNSASTTASYGSLSAQPNSGGALNVMVSGVVSITLASTTTVYMQAIANVSGAVPTIKATSLSQGLGKISGITALRTA